MCARLSFILRRMLDDSLVDDAGHRGERRRHQARLLALPRRVAVDAVPQRIPTRVYVPWNGWVMTTVGIFCWIMNYVAIDLLCECTHVEHSPIVVWITCGWYIEYMYIFFSQELMTSWKLAKNYLWFYSKTEPLLADWAWSRVIIIQVFKTKFYLESSRHHLCFSASSICHLVVRTLCAWVRGKEVVMTQAAERSIVIVVLSSYMSLHTFTNRLSKCFLCLVMYV